MYFEIFDVFSYKKITDLLILKIHFLILEILFLILKFDS